MTRQTRLLAFLPSGLGKGQAGSEDRPPHYSPMTHTCHQVPPVLALRKGSWKPLPDLTLAGPVRGQERGHRKGCVP